MPARRIAQKTIFPRRPNEGLVKRQSRIIDLQQSGSKQHNWVLLTYPHGYFQCYTDYLMTRDPEE